MKKKAAKKRTPTKKKVARKTAVKKAPAKKRARVKISDLREEIEDLKLWIRDIEREKKSATNQLKRAVEQKQSLEELIAEKDREILKFRCKLVTQMDLINDQWARIARLQKEAAQLRVELSNQSVEMNKVTQAYASLKADRSIREI